MNQMLPFTQDSLDQALQEDLTKTYRTTFSMREFALPLTKAEFDGFFRPQINLFAGDDVARASGVSRNTTTTNAVDMPFLVRCIAVYIAVEPLGFTAAGGAFAPPAAGTDVPAFDGILRITAGSGVGQQAVAPAYATQDLAWLEWGLPTWKAAHAFMQAYRLTMRLGNRLELFNELCADVGNLDSHSEWEGFSNSLSELPQYVESVNERAITNAKGVIFLPPTAQAVASLPGVNNPVVIGVPTPLIPASWGGPKMEGLFCGCYPVRGILLVPGMPINLLFVRDESDVLYYDKLETALVDSANIKYAANYTDNVVTGGGAIVAKGTFQEFKGGTMRVGVVMRGFELTPRAAIQWYGTYGGSFGQLYNISTVLPVLQQYAVEAKVPGGATDMSTLRAWIAGGAGLGLSGTGDDADAEPTALQAAPPRRMAGLAGL